MKYIKPIKNLDDLKEGDEILIQHGSMGNYAFRNYSGHGYVIEVKEIFYGFQEKDTPRLKERGLIPNKTLYLKDYVEFPFTIGFDEESPNSEIVDWLREQEKREEKSMPLGRISLSKIVERN
ncbi:hypothetical protein HN865_00760 [Candidatus Woesearchaeota archaeon]|jgi:hypothetical protein|nr:hypothetical protein [Candidatus Woesearchaeota archaeon]MBT7237370.1 hypothetical protein [Candidatus Woesearchaeota archaeon]